MKMSKHLITTLGDYQVTVSSEAHQSHLIFRVEVPKSTEEISIQYTYSPTEERAEVEIDRIFKKYQQQNSMADEDREGISSIRNLITVSVRSSAGYEGSCHRFEEEGTIVINERCSTPGMRTKKIMPGFWDITLNFHALVTPITAIRCKIQALHQAGSIVENPIIIEKMDKPRLDRRRVHERAVTYQKVELHSHTVHSDASHTAEQLITDAINNQIDWLAITDHNTTSVFEEIVDQSYPIRLIAGVEMTTFHGHFLAIGCQQSDPVDWTKIDRANINETIALIKEQAGLIGIAHPFDTGSPYCTGCRWQYVLESIEHIDFIEVWNSEDPHLSLSNVDALAKWTQLLNSGIEIAATCGRDWHHSETNKRPAYLYVEGSVQVSEQDLLHAIKLGRSYLTLEPQIELLINGNWTIGDRLELGKLDVKVKITQSEMIDRVTIESNLGVLYESGEAEFCWKMEEMPDLLWLRVSGFDQDLNRVLITNPVYFEKGDEH